MALFPANSVKMAVFAVISRVVISAVVSPSLSEGPEIVKEAVKASDKAAFTTEQVNSEFFDGVIFIF